MHLDLNVPLDGRGRISDDLKISNSLPTIKYLTKKGAKIVIITHLGRPKGKVVKKLSTLKLAEALSKRMRKKVKMIGMALDPKTMQEIIKAKANDIMILENIRFYQKEMKGDEGLAKKLSHLGDIFVYDAFAVAHRDHASISKIQKYLPSYAGFLVEKEYNSIKKFFDPPKRPFLVIIGGAKISTKIDVLKSLIKKHKPAKGKGTMHPYIKTLTQTGTCPPQFTVQIRELDTLHFSYLRYIENGLRQKFGFEGTAIRMSVVTRNE